MEERSSNTREIRPPRRASSTEKNSPVKAHSRTRLAFPVTFSMRWGGEQDTEVRNFPLPSPHQPCKEDPATCVKRATRACWHSFLIFKNSSQYRGCEGAEDPQAGVDIRGKHTCSVPKSAARPMSTSLMENEVGVGFCWRQAQRMSQAHMRSMAPPMHRPWHSTRTGFPQFCGWRTFRGQPHKEHEDRNTTPVSIATSGAEATRSVS